MNIIFKYIVKIFIVIVSIILLVILISFINHKIQLSKEEDQFIPPGQLIDINGHKLHVYTEGQGEETLIFMAGGGTSSPVLDFKSLYSLLSDKYKIVVVEKLGYGFSDVTNSDREIDIILDETREALKKSGVEGPYILYPHSMSGIEALRWTQIYPKEIKAIVGLDMAVPAAYENFDINMPLIKLGGFAVNAGLVRWIPNQSRDDAIKYGSLTEEEKKLYEIISYQRTSTQNMINEVSEIKANAQKVEETKIPDVPMLLFSSNGEGTGFNKEEWDGFQNEFIKRFENVEVIKLDQSHFLHNIEYEEIEEVSEEFIKRLN